MKNSQLLPFERNRYYAGKALTSADFTAEQLYMNNKRRFMNHAMYGSGIICGMGVVCLDDMSVMVESGAAIDAAGREIVVEAATVKKLAALDGYDRLDGDRALLCIRYKEKEVHPVYRTPAGEVEADNPGYECNRIDEGYELYLVSGNEDRAVHSEAEAELFCERVLIDDDNYRIRIGVPAIVPIGKDIRIDVEVMGKSGAAPELSFEACFEVQEPANGDGTHKLEICFVEDGIKEGSTVHKSFWFHVGCTEAGEACLLAQRENITIREGGCAARIAEDIAIHICLTEERPEEVAVRVFGRQNLEQRSVAGEQERIELAEVLFMDIENDYIIREIREKGIKRYIALPGEEEKRRRYLSCFRDIVPMPAESGKEQTVVHEAPEFPFNMAAGTLEIPLRANMKKGSVCYSEEIVHGLGAGNVYVEVGLALREIASDRKSDIIYGDAGLFHNEEFNQITTAVKVKKLSGSFQVAVKLKGKQKSVIVPLNWIAIRIPEHAERIREEEIKETGQEGRADAGSDI